MSAWSRLNAWRKETYFQATPLLGGDAAKDVLMAGPAGLVDLLRGGKKEEIDEALLRKTVGRDAPRMERVDICMAGLEEERDFEMATLWAGDDLEIRVLSYNPAVSIEDISVDEIISAIRGEYDLDDHPETIGRLR